MRRLAWESRFRRAFKRHVKDNPAQRDRILRTLRLLTDDPYQAPLKTHKLSGRLGGLWACWVEYDCRIVFAFEPDPQGGEDMIVLIGLGTHDEVY